MVKPLIAFQKCLKYKSEAVHQGRCCKAHVSLFQINLLLKRRSITQEPKPFREDCFILLFSTIYHLFLPTFTAGWRPESNKASFLMMFPTPGMTAWSMRTSHNIRRLWLLTASSEWEKLKCWEHTSRASKALTFCTQSSVNLQIYMRHKVNCCILEIMQVWTVFFHVVLSVLLMRRNSKGEISGGRNKCPSGCPTIHHDLTVNEQDKCQAKETVFFMRQQPLTSDTA